MEVVDRIARKFENAALAVPKPELRLQDGSDVGLITIGSCDGAVREAVDRLRERGYHVDLMRIKAFPFGPEVREFLLRNGTTFVIEQNRDAQLRSLLAIETGAPRDTMIPILDYSGLPLTATNVVATVAQFLAGLPL
jgi:2-oxoglutarate ferredoxin oxidoreductase subunit alpha